MTVEFERDELDRQGGTLTAQSLDEVELRTFFVGADHSRIERCKLAEDTRMYPQPACSFPGVDGVGNAH